MLNVKNSNMTIHETIVNKEKIIDLYSTALSIKIIWEEKTVEFMKSSWLEREESMKAVAEALIFIRNFESSLKKQIIHESEDR